MIPAFRAVAETIKRGNIEPVFGVLGDANMLWVAEFVAAGGSYVGAVDERGALAMADGFSRIEGFGISTVTHGPGLTNALTSLVEAVRAHSPVVLITGDTPGHREYTQRVDIASVVAPTGAQFCRAFRPEQAADTIAQACRSAMSARTPVVVDIPHDFLCAEIPHRSPKIRLPDAQAIRADDRRLDEAITVLLDAHSPLILAGRGAVLSGAGPALVTLADALNAPLATTLRAKNIFRNTPRTLGFVGLAAHEQTRKAVEAADCLLVFGAGLNDLTTENGALTAGKDIVRVDIDERCFGHATSARIELLGDVRAVADEMLHRMGRHEQRQRVARSTTVDDPVVCRPLDTASTETDQSTETFDARAAMIALNQLLPADRSVVTDLGRFAVAAWQHLDVEDARLFTHMGSFGAIGLGLPGAVGVATATSSRPTIAVVGDGGAMMSLIEFTTAVREQLQLVVLVINDECYGAEWDQLRRAGLDHSVSRMRWPDLSELARAMGGHGCTVHSLADLSMVADHLMAGHLPLLVDIKVDPSTASSLMT